MFDFYKVECPVEETEKKWIEDSLLWLLSVIDKEENIKYKYISPKELFAGIKDLKPEEIAYHIQKKFSDHLRIIYPCTIIFENFTIIKNDGSNENYDYAGSYSLSSFDEGRITMRFKNEIANDFALVARDIFYYLTLYKLQYTYNVKPKIGHQIDMATIVFGGYSYLANSLFLFEKWQVGRGMAWRHNSRGYLKEETCGYCIAFLHYKEGVPTDFSPKDLGRNVKAYYNKSRRFIKSHSEYYLDVINKKAINLSEPPDFIYEHITQNDINQPPNLVWMKNYARHGLTTEYYKNGSFKGKSEYKDDELWTAISSYHPDGHQLEAGTLYQGNGTFYSYNHNGRLNCIFVYKDGKKIKEDFYQYYDSGQVAYISEIKNDKRDGLTTYFHKNGTLWAKWEYRNDVPWSAICNYNDKGEKVESGDLKDGNGILFSYNDEGILLFKYHYDKGKLVNSEDCKNDIKTI
ncbi:MAG: toxin-antitoxin system YwqK family antitoxin [Bacteroidia bacterium]